MLRARHDGGRLVLFELEPGRQWQIVRVGATRSAAAERYGEYDDLAEAERAVALLRWRDRTGEEFADPAGPV